MKRERKMFDLGEVIDKSLLGVWATYLREKNKQSKTLHFFREYEDFCDSIIKELFILDSEIKIYFTTKYILFEKSGEQFLGIEAQKKRISLAPIKLPVSAVRDLSVNHRDITDKTYSMGGNVRVYFERGDAQDFELAKKIITMAFSAMLGNSCKGYFSR